MSSEAPRRMPADLAQRVEAEIEAVHAFIAAWFRGDVPEDLQLFGARLADRWDDSLVNIHPSSETIAGSVVLDRMRRAHGASPDFEIEVSECTVRQAFPTLSGGLVVATYRELQRGARNSAAENTRFSTVVFEWTADEGEEALIWRHIHETGVPG